MKNKLYLDDLKRKYNQDENQNVIFEESQTGPQEEPCLLAYDVDIKQFKKYMHFLSCKRGRRIR